MKEMVVIAILGIGLVIMFIISVYLLITKFQNENRIRVDLLRQYKDFSSKFLRELCDVRIPDSIMSSFRKKNANQLEQFIPFFEKFSRYHDPNDAHFLGEPIDYIVFDGKTAGEIKQVTFIEVKQQPKLVLEEREKKIKEIVENRLVAWERIDISEDKKSITREEVKNHLKETEYDMHLEKKIATDLTKFENIILANKNSEGEQKLL